MGFASARTRMIQARGRDVVLARSGQTDIDLKGYPTAYRPEEIAGAVLQGDVRLAILAPGGWAAPPARGDFVTLDGAVWVVEGAEPKYEASVCIGYDLWIRGGA